MGILFCLVFNISFFCPKTESPSEAPTPAPTPGPSGFNIKLVRTGGVDTYDYMFDEARAKWNSVIVGDLRDVIPNPGIDLFDGILSQPYNKVVDDIVIGYEFEETLGFGVLGFAGPTYTRSDGTPYAGIMKFSVEEFQLSSESDNRATVLHEMGHVLGIGTLWGSFDANCAIGCQPNNRRDQTSYACSQAQLAYRQLKMQTTEPFGTRELFLSNDGGTGSACGHFESDSFDATDWFELMTPFADQRVALLTIVTTAALRDISRAYVTDDDMADPIPATPSELANWGLRVNKNADVERGQTILVRPKPENRGQDFAGNRQRRR